MTDTRQMLFTRGTVWSVSTSKWTGMDRLQAEDLGKDPDDILDIFILGKKKLLPDEWRNKLATPGQQVQALMRKFGRQFLGIRGVYFVPDKNLILVREGIARIQDRQWAIVDDFLTSYVDIKEEMIEKHPVLQEANWPSPDQIRSHFKIRMVVFEVSEASINPADPEELIQAKNEFARELRTDFETMKNAMLQEAHENIVEACNEIADKILEAGEKITESTLKKPKRVIDEYLAVAELFDADAIKEEVNRLKGLVDQTEAKHLRKNWQACDNFGEAMKSMAENLGDLTGINAEGQMKRRVKFDRAVND